MKKKLICTLVILTLSVNISIATYATGNDSLQSNKVHFEEVSNDIRDLDINISNVQEEIQEVNNSLNKNKDEIKNIETEVKNIENKINSSINAIEETQDVLSTRLRETYKSGAFSSLNYVAFVFESNGFSDFINRVTSIQKIISIDNKMIKSINKEITSLNNDKESLTLKQETVKNLNSKIEKDLVVLKEKENSIKSEREQLQAKKDSISTLIAENEKNLIKNQLSIINSSNSTLAQLTSAVRDLKGLLPQLSSSSVKSTASDAIKRGEALIAAQSNQGSNTSPSGNESYKSTFTMEASAYYGHTITATGTVPVRNPNGISTVAVDPNVIPLGSKLYIPNYGYAIAADTGGIIKGMKIDLFMNTREECYSFGRKNITVNLIAYPGEW